MSVTIYFTLQEVSIILQESKSITNLAYWVSEKVSDNLGLTGKQRLVIFNKVSIHAEVNGKTWNDYLKMSLADLEKSLNQELDAIVFSLSIKTGGNDI